MAIHDNEVAISEESYRGFDGPLECDMSPIMDPPTSKVEIEVPHSLLPDNTFHKNTLEVRYPITIQSNEIDTLVG